MYWYMNSATTGSVAVTDITSIGGVFDTTQYGMDVIFNGTGNYGHVQVDGTSGSPLFPMNWSTCSLIGIQAWVWASPTATGGFTAYPYIVANGNSYGGTYNNWFQQCGNPGPGCSYGQNAGTWGTYTLTINPSGAGTWSTDETNVTGVGVDFNLSAAKATDFVIDQIILY
jgi:hypothetical protein